MRCAACVRSTNENATEGGIHKRKRHRKVACRIELWWAVQGSNLRREVDRQADNPEHAAFEWLRHGIPNVQ